MAEARDYYQVKITIKDIEPDIWRRLLVPSGITFHKFHKIIQAAFDWQDYHLYLFELPDFLIKIPDLDYPLHEVEKNPKSIKVDTVFKEYQNMLYEYDFGDSWYHEIIIEDIVTRAEEIHIPICLGGERHRPPEDAGGTGGYEHFLSIIGDPQNPEYDEMLGWAEKDTGGRKFEPEYFYKPEINRRLAKIKC
ncbi:plasmid pRiA4b ORF-3 family protein [Bacillus benzoevorans]|uniref:Plasmid pRiA4b Orf3-like domain-containing protein n=1 Tax=Bacillus benzoevorans TaxID=1456 RepID=A0A7X0HVS3_9BACI|nr:plasmid pRiA4b ORF-3 family protein [Bacillus benzoevorans]MBB6447784.1 hypothetical protein [Bacillus benzoevorans]